MFSIELAQKDEVADVTNLLCDSLIGIASSNGFAGMQVCNRSMENYWSFPIEDLAVEIKKTGPTFDAEANHRNYTFSGGTRISVTDNYSDSESRFVLFRPSAAFRFATSKMVRTQRSTAELRGAGLKVGSGDLSLGDILDFAVELNADDFDGIINHNVSGAYRRTSRQMDFGAISKEFGKFSLISQISTSIEGAFEETLRSVDIRLLPKHFIFRGSNTHRGGFIVTDPQDITWFDDGTIPVATCPLVYTSANVRRYFSQKVFTLKEGEILVTREGLSRAQSIGESLIRFVSGYTQGYVDRFSGNPSSPLKYRSEREGYLMGRLYKT